MPITVHAYSSLDNLDSYPAERLYDTSQSLVMGKMQWNQLVQKSTTIYHSLYC